MIEQGELNLPKDFSFEVEKNSAFFSDEGTASLGVTIPATPEDLAKLGFPSRMARSTRYANLFPAVISKGAFQKQGQLAVTSVTDSNISCAMALEDSDFYSQFKETNIKELFSSQILTNYSTPAAWYNYLFNVYKGTTGSEFRVIPVAVNFNSSDNSYQVNNEPVEEGSSDIWPLYSQARLVTEGDQQVTVPEGYGIAPFYLLYRFIEKMFNLCGYSVQNDCFRTNPDLNTLLLLHNCSDVICKGQINLGDLVPNCTISEFLEWMLAKFHSQIVVYPEKKKVDIILMNDILTSGFDMDLNSKLIGKATLKFSPSSRLILKQGTSLDGAQPAAETEEDLFNKYGNLIQFTEAEGFGEISSFSLRLSTGCYYENRSGFSRTDSVNKAVGTNYFNFDKKNSESSEELAPEDLIPPMVFVNGILMPYIGERKHRNTSMNGTEIDEEQDIIIVDYAGQSVQVDYSTGSSSGGRVPTDAHGSHYFYGTTQKYDNAGLIREGRYTLNGPGLYDKFFRLYNKILLNNAVELAGKFLLQPAELLDYNMYSLKLIDGQLFIPKFLRYEVGKSLQCLEASFLLVKDFEDAVEEEDVVWPEPLYKWQINNSRIEAKKDQYFDQYCVAGRSYIRSRFADDYTDNVYMMPPTALGQQSAKILRTVEFYKVTYGGSSGSGSSSESLVATDELYQWHDAVSR